MFPIAISLFFTIGFCFMAPTAKIHASGGLMIAVNSSIPNIPRLDTVNVFPESSSKLIFLFLDLSAKSLILFEISRIEFLSVFL